MTPTQREAVWAEALTWLHTPYHHHGRIKGAEGGVDCLMYLAEVFERCGVIEHVDPGYYPVDWHLHRSDELYAHGLFKYCALIDHATAKPQMGDVALFKFGRCYSHGAIVGPDGLLLHSYLGRGVILSRATEEPLEGRLVHYMELK